MESQFEAKQEEHNITRHKPTEDTKQLPCFMLCFQYANHSVLSVLPTWVHLI
jgi:hypothetical protein